MTELYDMERLVRLLMDHERRLNRLEAEMDTARDLLAQQIKMSLERPDT